MTKNQVETYIRVDLDGYALMELLLSNTPIPELHTHSYGFHTRNGRGLIESMRTAYDTHSS